MSSGGRTFAFVVAHPDDGAIEEAFLGLPTTDRPHGVEFRELARDTLVAVVAPDHPLAGESAVNLRRLSSEVFVELPAKTAGRVQSDLAFEAAGLTRDVAFSWTSSISRTCRGERVAPGDLMVE